MNLTLHVMIIFATSLIVWQILRTRKKPRQLDPIDVSWTRAKRGELLAGERAWSAQ